MVQSLLVLVEAPIWGVLVDVGPVETVAAVGRVAEVVDFVPGLTEARYHLGIIFVPPAGGDVDLCHRDK